MTAPIDLSVTFDVNLNARTAAKFSSLGDKEIAPGKYPTTARVTLRPVEQVLLDKGMVTEDELREVYRDAIEAGQRIPYKY
jgi:hypothetical protein